MRVERCVAMRSVQVNLKQRLSNLSSAAASATSPLRGSDTSSSSRTSNFSGLSSAFNKRKAPWNNLPNRTGGYADGSSHNIDEVISQMIFQAGVDFEYVDVLFCVRIFSSPSSRTRPMYEYQHMRWLHKTQLSVYYLMVWKTTPFRQGSHECVCFSRPSSHFIWFVTLVWAVYHRQTPSLLSHF